MPANGKQIQHGSPKERDGEEARPRPRVNECLLEKVNGPSFFPRAVASGDAR